MNNKRKFTLIEVIISVVIFAVVATTTGVYLRNLLATVNEPGELIANSNSFRSIANSLRNEFKENYVNDLPGFKAIFETEASNSSNRFGGRYSILKNNYVEFNESSNTYIENSVASSNILLVKIKAEQGYEEATIVFIGD